jgi:sec-independent protein translocase protein TatC
MDLGTLGRELLNELKQKLTRLIAILVFGLIVGWTLAYYLILKIKAKMLPGQVELIALSPLEFVIVQLKISLIFALLVLLPVLIYWSSKRFDLKLKKPSIMAWGAMLAIFFSAGMAFAYFLLLPYIINFLTSTVVKAGIEPMYSLDGFMFFTISMMFILGLVFEFPVITAWMSRAGMVSSKTLSTKRRYAYVGIFVVAAVITPDPSPVSQILVAVPFLFFYEISVISAKIFGRR